MTAKPSRLRLPLAALALAFGLGGLVASAPPAEAGPAITSPRLNQKIGSSRYYIRWQAERGARSYYIRIREAGSSTYWVEQAVSGSSYAFNTQPYQGRRFEVFVWSCTGSNGTQCGTDSSTVGAYIYGPPVVLSSPADGDSIPGSTRRPTFSWQPYTGIHPSSGGGTVNYTVTVSGNGAAPTTFPSTTSTSYQPPQAINPAYQNPIRWAVKACTSYNCSSSGGTRSLTLGGSSFDQLTGNVEFHSPGNGTAVDVGSQLKWVREENAATYKICLNVGPSGCRIIRTQDAQLGNPQVYTLTASDLDAKPPFGDYYFRGKTMYWGIQACTDGNTQCIATAAHRFVQVAAAPSGGGAPGGGTPQVSFAQDLYPTFASNACNSCHASGTYHPQIANRPSNCQASCSATTIPFTTAITASTMLDLLKCLRACSGQPQYSQAFGKVYVVPGNPNNSALHHKGQESTAPIFGSPKEIDGVTKPLREWIQIWIQQGANP